MLIHLLYAAVLSAVLGAASTPSRDATRLPQVAVDGPGVMITSTGTASALALRETAGPDTFAIYGGPDRPGEGKFQNIAGTAPEWGGWTGVDDTERPVYWQLSTFGAENLNNNGAGNLAMWCGQTAAQQPTWAAAPGYGNGWVSSLIYESAPVSDPSAGQTVGLDFWFNHDTEPGYDYFNVQYDSAGTWVTNFRVDGYNANHLGNYGDPYTTPGIQYSTVTSTPIQYAGNDYGGDAQNQIRIRLLVTSDGAFSNADGFWPAPFGAAQVDDITLTHADGAFVEDFEGPEPFLFEPHRDPFAGDFARLYTRITEVDACRENTTPVAGFIDFGQDPPNGPGVNGWTSTGGSTSPGIVYGISGNYVVNYTGGLSDGLVPLMNYILSPDIAWDLPGPQDDGPDMIGASLRFSVWSHLPVANGMFWRWQFRSSQGTTNEYRSWEDRTLGYYDGGAPAWRNRILDVTDLVVTSPNWVQTRLGVVDFADLFGFPGTAATPSPVFDNVALYKYRIGGPALSTRTIDTANDGFPASGSTDVSTQASRDALDIPFDMARDVNSGDLIIDSGDSVIMDAPAKITGTYVTDVRMFWALTRNPLFEDAIRSIPARPKDENTGVDVGSGRYGEDSWRGEVVAETARTSFGAIVADRYFVDLPDTDFLYPGDRLEYYIQATDSDGRVSTLPNDISGFGLFDGTYDRAFTVNGLPSIQDVAGTQPGLLVYNDFGRRGGENDFLTSFRELGYREGIDYDTYTTQGASSGVSNGIGSNSLTGHGHGAAAGQLAGYNHIFYFAGDLATQLLSNGETNLAGNDKSDDIGVLEAWSVLGGGRNVAYFGDYIATSLTNDSPEGLAWLGSKMGVAQLGSDVGPAIGNQTAPVVRPLDLANFSTEFVAYGGCQAINQFDHIAPLPGAIASHGFVDPVTDTVIAGAAASVEFAGATGTHVTFPYSVMFVYGSSGRATTGFSPRTALFEELLTLFGAPPATPPATAAPSIRRLGLQVFPNPLNPATVIEFTAPQGSRGSVKVFTLRGELVRTLHEGEFRTDRFRWDGTDTQGASVASGVYLIRGEAAGQVRVTKAALVK